MSQPPTILQLADEYANACMRSHGTSERKRLQAAILVSELDTLEAQKRYDALLDEVTSLRDRLSDTTQSRDRWQTQHLEALVAVAKHSPVARLVVPNPGDLVVQMAVRAEREACARVAEGRLQEGLNFEGCARAIRARGVPTPLHPTTQQHIGG